MALRIAVVGLGKIAGDQHIPAIAASGAFELVAAAGPDGSADGVPVFPTVAALLAAPLAIDAVAMCQPPQARFDAAAQAIRAGKHVLLEKPPGATLAEVAALRSLAAAAGTTLFAAWHSRHAPAVEPARAWLAGRRIRAIDIAWKEDVRRWHPGQRWIWQAGGLGVFDPGINALSILTRILPDPPMLRDGTMAVPAGRDAPIAADLAMAGIDGFPVRAAFDWRQTGPQTWTIAVATDDGALRIEEGGARLTIDGGEVAIAAAGEYPALYARFAELIAAGASEADCAPLALVADAFLRCRRTETAAFDD